MRFPFEEPPKPGELIEVAEGVLWTRMPLPMRLDHVNVYLLDDGDGWTVVDTGFKGNHTARIWDQVIAQLGKPIRRIVVTHHHPDHIGQAGRLMAAHDAPLITTRTAWILARMMTLDHRDDHAPETLLHQKRAGASAEQVAKYAAGPVWNFSQTVDPLPLGYQRIKEGDRIEMGGRRWAVRIGNGHAPEHATFWSEDDHLVLAGDQIIPGISSNLGVYATEPDADPVGDWLESCVRLKRFARADHLVLPGHKRVFTGLPARLDQLIDNHHSALNRLRAVLETPKTAVQCFVPIFGKEIAEAVYSLALNEAVAHMNHLHQTGEATRILDADGAYRFQLRASQAEDMRDPHE